ncbi:MAG: acetyl-CoA C-acyltransferase [Deltaproteobacteria bacterium]|nr:acetyl-CoA C-acyltransferase [Deltaproteobacteria bacterium]
MKKAVIVAAARTAVGRAKKGALANVRPDDMAAAVIQEVVKRTPGLNPEEIDDIILGCAFPEHTQGLNFARVAAMKANMPHSVPAQTVNRFCSSGLQTIALAGERIMCGFDEAIIAGGAESMSQVPMTGYWFAPNPTLSAEFPGAYMNMGLTAENVAEKYQVSRADQDAFGLASNTKALAAIESGVFKDQIMPLEVTDTWVDDAGRLQTKTKIFNVDEGPRKTTLEQMAKLKSPFKAGGSVTAGNSSQMSDAAAAVLVMEKDRAKSLGLKPLAKFIGFAVAGVDPRYMGIGPIEAIPKLMKKTGLKLDKIGLIELNEAFASQALAVVRTLGINPEIVNVNGGAIALGHPLGCTGAKLTVQLIHEMKRRQVEYGMVSMCIGGGMGAAGVFENID